jgi:hypothetical protein
MASIVFDDWSGGQDNRRAAAMSAAKILTRLRNCYVTDGRAIKKRACLRLFASLEPGTVGLKAAAGKLNTFYGSVAAITHADTRFLANRVAHKDATPAEPSKIHYGELFNGFLYTAVEYANGDVQHHYLDDPGAWVAATNYALTNIRRPTVPNGFRYEVTADAGSSAAGEPVWPTVVGATVVDGGITWTCRSFAVVDANCPNSTIVRKMQQKIYAADGADVAFCKTTDPRDWTTASDAGFIPSGLHAQGSDEVSALGDYRGDLVIFFSDGAQVWDVDADPANNALKTTSANIGTVHSKTPQPFADDLTFLAKAGFRSVSIAVMTDNLSENDIGSQIDALRSEISAADDVIAIFYPTLGQLWEINGDTAYVFTYSKSQKIKAWGVYDFPVEITDAAVLDNELYLRSGDDIYIADDTIFEDDGSIPSCEVDMFFQDAEAPGVLKQFTGFDCVVTGEPTIAFRYDPRNTALVTDAIGVTSDTRPGDLLPMEICATSVAPIVRHQANEAFGIDAIQCYFQPLGPV